MLVTSSPILAQTANYTVLELPGAVDGGNVASALNDFGAVAGRVGGTLANNTLAVVWSRDRHKPNRLTALFAGEYSSASAISDSEEVVGASNTPSGLVPFIWDVNQGMRRLPLPAGDNGGQALAINRSGQVVGYSSGLGGTRAVVWTRKNGIRELLGLSGSKENRARRINNAGEVVGSSVTAAGGRAVLWSATGVARDLGTLPGHTSSEATAINDAGQVVGWSKAGDGVRAFLWTKTGGMEDLGVLPGANSSRALDINDAGVVVGTSTGDAGDKAFVWARSGGMTDLNTTVLPPLHVIFIEAQAINQKGQILASGIEAEVNENGESACAPAPPSMFLLSPSR